MLRRKNKQRPQRSEYATCRDFQQIFTEDMAGLHLLAFLLTADTARAEQCFVAGLDDTIKGNPVFREWARSWSKRAIVKRAIRMMAPAPGDAQPATAAKDSAPGYVSDERGELITAVTALAPFQRFVFVMGVLESYSVTECALLLGRTVREVMAAQAEAIQQVSLRRSAVHQAAVHPPTWDEFLPAANAA